MTMAAPTTQNRLREGRLAGPELQDQDRALTSRLAGDSAHSGLQWTSHPFVQESHLKSASLLAILCAAAGAAWYGLGGVLYGAVALVLLTASVSRYLLPTHFAVSEKGVRCSHLFRTRLRPWREFHRLDCHGDGLFLSPFVRRSRLETPSEVSSCRSPATNPWG